MVSAATPSDRENKRAWHRFDIAEWNEPAHVATGERIRACQALNYSALGLAMAIPPGDPIPASGILEFRGALFSYDTRSCYERGEEQVVGVALQSLMPSIYEVVPNRPFFGAASPYFTPSPSRTSYIQWLMAVGLVLAVLLVVGIYQSSSREWMYQALSGFAPGRQFLEPVPNSHANWFADVFADGCHGMLLAARRVDLKAHLQRTRDVLTGHQLDISEQALGLGDFQSALEAAERALELNAHSPEAFFLRGRARLALGLRSFAVSDLKQAVFLDKLNLSRYRAVTGLLCDAFEFGEAFELCLLGTRAANPEDLKAMSDLTQSVYNRAASHSKATGEPSLMNRVIDIAEQWVKTHDAGSPTRP
jgi:hypothetical protein